MSYQIKLIDGLEGSFEERCQKLANLIKKHKNKTVFFGGAGVSTASGIPDFRSNDGLYEKENKYEYNPEKMLSNSFFNHRPKIFYQYYRENFDLRNYEPNECHKVLAWLERQGYVKGIITQNVDGLHQKAGSHNVVELHGTISDNYCLKCKKHFDINYIFDNQDAIPRCDCGRENSFVRPNIVLYGEQLDNDNLNRAFHYMEDTELLIVGGTSLVVQPASSFVSSYLGEDTVIINQQETPYDQYADIIFRESIDEVFKKVKEYFVD